VAEAAWDLLLRFHREVMRPEVDKILSAAGGMMMKSELSAATETLNERFERLHNSSRETLATLGRIEQQMTKLSADAAALRAKSESKGT
jgi:prefoldin subunit 5